MGLLAAWRHACVRVCALKPRVMSHNDHDDGMMRMWYHDPISCLGWPHVSSRIPHFKKEKMKTCESVEFWNMASQLPQTCLTQWIQMGRTFGAGRPRRSLTVDCVCDHDCGHNHKRLHLNEWGFKGPFRQRAQDSEQIFDFLNKIHSENKKGKWKKRNEGVFKF